MKHRREAGFSLLEVVIALAIIAIALLGIVSTFVHSINMGESEREQQIAKQAASKKIEEIRTATFDTLYATYNGDTFAVDKLVHAGGPGGKGLGTVAVDNTNADLLEIQVTVQWKGILGDGTYSLRSMQSR